MLLKQLQIKQLKIVKSTGDVIDNEIVDPVASLFDNNKITRPTSKNAPSKSIQAKNAGEISKEVYIPPEKVYI